MLHVASPPPSPPLCQVANPFDPIAYVAHVRNNGLGIHASHRDGERRLSWDITGRDFVATDVRLHHHPDPHLNIDADPDNQRLVWETLRAEAYIAAARSCHLVIFPWGPSARGRYGTMIFGEEMDGKYDYSAGIRRLLRHPDGTADDDCRRGLVFRVLCTQFDVEPNDPELWKKVDARRGEPVEQVPS